MNKSTILSFSLIVLLLLLPSCRFYKLERQLDPENAEFLSKVRYIITKEERKIFLELPDSEKEKFREEFWRRRDPEPDTEENEFKMEYFNRIEKANEIFLGEGRPGWLTDRGRIFVIFGPPTDRIKNPMGQGPYSRCSEVWYYGNFPVWFVDNYCNGTYELIPFNMDHLHYLNIAQHRLQKTFKEEKEIFDFSLKVEKTQVSLDRIEGIITIEIPYKVIWFKSEDERLVTILDAQLELNDSKGNLVWDYKDAFKIETDEIGLQQKQKKKYKIEIPFVLEEDLEILRQGRNIFHVLLKNRIGGEELKKRIDFKL